MRSLYLLLTALEHRFHYSMQVVVMIQINARVLVPHSIVLHKEASILSEWGANWCYVPRWRAL